MEQIGVTIWFTGLSGSGKTTLARAIEERLLKMDAKVELLDGDEVREHLSKDLAYSKADRSTNISRIAYVASLLARNGVIVLVAAISPYREAREAARAHSGDFVEVYCRCPLEVAESRDVKNLYKKARRGEISNFTGIDDPYEEPLRPDVLLDTGSETIHQSMEKLWRTLNALRYVPNATEFANSSPIYPSR